MRRGTTPTHTFESDKDLEDAEDSDDDYSDHERSEIVIDGGCKNFRT